MKPSSFLFLLLAPAAAHAVEADYIGRLGLFSGAEFTRSSDNFQASSVSSLTESGYARGWSYRYNGSTFAGYAAWVADATTGVTNRVGLFSGAEFTRSSDNDQTSDVSSLTDSGYASGSSRRYSGSNDAGNAVWVANAATGATTRVGFFSGAEFTSTSNNYQDSDISSVTESGYLGGQSSRYNGAADAGQAAWAANAATGTTTRVGLFSGAEFTRTTDNYQFISFPRKPGTYAGFPSATTVRQTRAAPRGWRMPPPGPPPELVFSPAQSSPDLRTIINPVISMAP